MWLAKNINNKKLKTFVFPRLVVPFIFVIPYALGVMHLTLALYLLLFGLLAGWLPTKIGWLTAKALFPSLPARCDVESWRWRKVVIVGALLLLAIPFSILFYHLGVPEWALLTGIETVRPVHLWSAAIILATAVAALTAQFATVLFFAWRLQKKKGE